jgi:hypothetical protein
MKYYILAPILVVAWFAAMLWIEISFRVSVWRNRQ